MVSPAVRQALRRSAANTRRNIHPSPASQHSARTATPLCNRISAYSKIPFRNYSSTSSSSSTTTPNKPPQYGQQLSRTHSHLIKPTELTTGITAGEYEDRRKRLMGSLPDGSIVICMGGTVRLVSQSIFYKFRQATDFYYLTGFNEPDAALILESKPSTSKGYTYTLFVPETDEKEALWDGRCTGVQGAIDIFGADAAYSNTSLFQHLPALLRKPDIYASLPPSPSSSASSQPFQIPSPRRRSSLLKLFTSSTSSDESVKDRDPPHLQIAAALAGGKAKPLEKEVHRLRIVKSDGEVRLMKRAAELSSEGHTKVMRFAEGGMSESALAARFEYHCALGGSERPAYVPVVASGANALVIHYTKNDCLIDPGDLILIDAGCEYAMYASDITRTFPASGRFTDPQRDLYTAVLTAQKELVRRCRVGDVSLNELQRTACSLMTEELRQIGFKLATGDLERRLYPHYISHHLGSDLHDCPSNDRSSTLTAGNVITVEPGVYIPADPAWPKHFHGMGIRIEDEVAFTREGPHVLSAGAPKEVVDVEGACQGLLER